MAYEDLLKDTSVADPSKDYFTLTITDLNPNTSYPIQLRWKYKDGTFSNWSAVKRLAAKNVDPKPSELPSVPTVKPVTGAIELAWNGKTSTGANQPFGFNSAKVYIGTSSGFTPTDSGDSKNLIDILNFANGQNTLNIGVETVVNSSLTLTYGVDYFVKIKTTNGNAAQDSAEVAATGNPVRIGQLSNTGLISVSADKITTGTLQANASITVGAVDGKRVILSSGSDPIKVYGSGGTADPLLGLDSLGNLLIKGIITATSGAFTGSISINGIGGAMKIGQSVGKRSNALLSTDPIYDGIYIGTNNYWYNDGFFEVGNGSNGLRWNGTSLSLTGSITASSFTSVNSANGNGVSITSNSGNDEMNFYRNSNSQLRLYSSTSGALIDGPANNSIFFLNGGGMQILNNNNTLVMQSNTDGGFYIATGTTPNASRLRNIDSDVSAPTLTTGGATTDGALNGDIYLVRE
jgi:hypothetical protein